MSEANTSKVYYNKLKRADPNKYKRISFKSWQETQRNKWNAAQQVKTERLTNIDNIKSQADNNTIYYKIGLSKNVYKTTPKRFQQIRQQELSRAKILTREQYEFRLKANSQPRADRVKIVNIPGEKTKYYNIDTKKGREDYNKLVLNEKIKSANERFKSDVEYKKAKIQYEKKKDNIINLFHQRYKAETFGSAGIAPYRQQQPIQQPQSKKFEKVSLLKPDVYDEIYGFDKDNKIINSAKQTAHAVPSKLKEMGLSLGRGLYKTVHWRAATNQRMFDNNVIDPVTGYPDVWKDQEAKAAIKTTATLPVFYIPGVTQAAAIYGTAKIGTGLRTYNPELVAEGSVLVAPYVLEKGFRFVKIKGGKVKTRVREYRFKLKDAKIESKYGKYELPNYKTERVFIQSPFKEKGIGKLPAKGESSLQFIETIRKPVGYDVITRKSAQRAIELGKDPLLANQLPELKLQTETPVRQTTLTGELKIDPYSNYYKPTTSSLKTYKELAIIKNHPWDITKYPSKSTGTRLIEGEGFTFKQDIFKPIEGTKINKVNIAKEFQRSLTEYKSVEFKSINKNSKLLTGDILKPNINTFRGSRSLFKNKGAALGRQTSSLKTEGKFFSSERVGEIWGVPKQYKGKFRNYETFKPVKFNSGTRFKSGFKPININRNKTKSIFKTDNKIFINTRMPYKIDTIPKIEINLKQPFKEKSKQKEDTKLKPILYTIPKTDNPFKFRIELPPIPFKPDIPRPIKIRTPLDPIINIDIDLKRGFEKNKKGKELIKSKRKYIYTATFEAAFEKQFTKKGKKDTIFTGLERRGLLS